MTLEDPFWGARCGKLQDPHGYSWGVSFEAKASKAELEKTREEAMEAFGAGEHP